MSSRLKVKKESSEGVNVIELSVEAPSSYSDKAYAIALKNVSENLSVPGFRKGKIPRDIVERSVGIPYVQQKAFEVIFGEVLFDVANQEDMDIVDVVDVLSYELNPSKPFAFKVKVELKPEIKIEKYKGLKIKTTKYIYDEKNYLSKKLDELAHGLATFKKNTDQPVKHGDLVVVDYEGKFEDGSDVPSSKGVDHYFSLDEKNSSKEFIDQLVGAKLNEVKKVEIVFKENAGDVLAGKKAIFTVTVKDIEEKVLPEINDNLAQTLGFKDLEHLRTKIVDQLKSLQEINNRRELENNLVDKLLESIKINISEKMLDKEVDFLLNDIKARWVNGGSKWDDFKNDEKNKELIASGKKAAEKRITVDILLSTIIKLEEITATQNEIDIEVRSQLSKMPKAPKNIEQNKNFLHSVKQIVLRNKAVEFLIKNNEIISDEKTAAEIPEY